MHVIFLAPHFPANQRQFVRGLKAVGARVTGIGDAPAAYLDDQVRGMLDGYEYVRNVCDVDAVTAATRRIQERGPWVHHLEAAVEAHMLTAAAVRERTGIPGLSYEAVNLCRDKFVMKNFLRERGIPCARNAAVSTPEEALAFVEEVGFPVILKPRDGAGAQSTYRLDSLAELQQAIAETGLDKAPRFFTMEEFITGHEGFYDTLTVNGQVVFEGICHYYPGVLEAMRSRWISPQIVTTNRIDAPGYDEVKRLGREVIAQLGLTTTATHMEWFYGPRGLSFSEIGARPPGCTLWDIYCEANEFDLYTEWARGVCWSANEHRPTRRYAAGLVSVRPSQDGVVRGYTGVEEIQRRYGEHLFRLHLPPPGSLTNPVGAGYLAHAYAFVKHPDYDACRAILDDIGRTLKMWAE
jgi:carbamoylphosphate synthase large subunit